MMLEGVNYEVFLYDNIAYKFIPAPGFEAKCLDADELNAIDRIVGEFGALSTQQIIDKMHDEEAYKCTDSRCIIPYSFAARLSID